MGKQDRHVLEMMHRCDEALQSLDARKAKGENVSKDIKDREKLLLPMYRQVSVMYCDLHDRSARMKSLGAIHEELEWRQSRTYLHWRIRRRLCESGVLKKIQAAVPDFSHAEAKSVLQGLLEGSLERDIDNNQIVAQWLEAHKEEVDTCVEEQR